MDFSLLVQRAAHIRRLYAEFEKQRYGRSWTDEELALGFVGDVGDLVKLIQSRNGVRQIENVDTKLAHELADCLWSVIVLSDAYGVDLEQAFLDTMNQLEQYLGGE